MRAPAGHGPPMSVGASRPAAAVSTTGTARGAVWATMIEGLGGAPGRSGVPVRWGRRGEDLGHGRGGVAYASLSHGMG